jgi:hypothetical protein
MHPRHSQPLLRHPLQDSAPGGDAGTALYIHSHAHLWAGDLQLLDMNDIPPNQQLVVSRAKVITRVPRRMPRQRQTGYTRENLALTRKAPDAPTIRPQARARRQRTNPAEPGLP